MRKIEPLTVAVFAALLWLGFYGGQIGGCPLPDLITTDKAVAGTYFYEQRAGDPPQPVSKAISTLNERENFIATQEDIDSLTANGTVPKQYELTLPEAKKVGPPVWVTRSASRVLKSVKNPQTAEDILETAP